MKTICVAALTGLGGLVGGWMVQEPPPLRRETVILSVQDMIEVSTGETQSDDYRRLLELLNKTLEVR